MSEIKTEFRHTANIFEDHAWERKRPTGSSSIGGSSLHGLVEYWDGLCFTHPYYNRVGIRMVVGRSDDQRAKRKPANHVGCTQWAGRNHSSLDNSFDFSVDSTGFSDWIKPISFSESRGRISDMYFSKVALSP